jgi:hypothetical protein
MPVRWGIPQRARRLGLGLGSGKANVAQQVIVKLCKARPLRTKA